MEVSIQVEEQEGKHQEVASLEWPSQLPVWSGPALEPLAVEEHLQTAGEACLPGRVDSERPGVALRPSRDALLWNLS